jgi:hypothetical protein
LSFWKIVAISLFIAILLATIHMEIRDLQQQVDDYKHYEIIGN